MALVSRLKLMASLDISEKRLPQDGRFDVRVNNKTIDVRLSTLPTTHGEAVVLRLADQSSGLADLAQIGMTDDVLARFVKLIKRPHGLILVTGPTGSGKTTTLYAALSRLNQKEKKIITVEDPVELQLERVNQVQVMPRIGLDFARVLRTTLRQDPDILLVGEIRDAETAEIALRASMTGHLVLSTLHTNDAISSALRLLDIGVEGYLAASALRAVVAQRLVRRVCPRCREAHRPNDAERAWLSTFAPDLVERQFMLGTGCNQCARSGYLGRVGVFELLEIKRELADALRQGDPAAFESAARAQPGFKSLVQSALELAVEGVTSLSEVMSLSSEEEEIWQPATASSQASETLEERLVAADVGARREQPDAPH